jgi:hypothetical protein
MRALKLKSTDLEVDAARPLPDAAQAAGTGPVSWLLESPNVLREDSADHSGGKEPVSELWSSFREANKDRPPTGVGPTQSAGNVALSELYDRSRLVRPDSQAISTGNVPVS